MEFDVELKTVQDNGKTKRYHGRLYAKNVLNAVGQACIQYGVQTDSLVYLKIERSVDVDEA